MHRYYNKLRGSVEEFRVAMDAAWCAVWQLKVQDKGQPVEFTDTDWIATGQACRGCYFAVVRFCCAKLTFGSF